MKEKIHPEYYEDAVIKCACGNVATVGSTKKEMSVEICTSRGSKCSRCTLWARKISSGKESAKRLRTSSRVQL